MKVLSIVVTYYPDISLLKENIGILLRYVDHILVWENMPKIDAVNYRVVDSPKIEFVGSGDNVGISRALNFAWKYAKEYGYDGILTMDQDSIWDNLGQFLKKIEASPLKESAIFSPNQGTEHVHIPFNPIDHSITSGMFVPLLVLNTTGGYLEDFLIDGIDVEFCYRARRFGINTYTVSGCYLRQRYGSPMVKRFLWKKYIVSNYSPFRLYGILKNFKIISQLYPNEKGVRRELKKVYLYQFVRNILFYEDNKKAKLLAIFSGYLHGKYYNRLRITKMLNKYLPKYQV